MDFTPDFGWYYRTPDDRAPAWTSVAFFYDFITEQPLFAAENAGIGPFGREVRAREIEIGDFIQLADEEGGERHVPSRVLRCQERHTHQLPQSGRPVERVYPGVNRPNEYKESPPGTQRTRGFLAGSYFWLLYTTICRMIASTIWTSEGDNLSSRSLMARWRT